MDGYQSYQSGTGTGMSAISAERFQYLIRTINSNIQKMSQNTASITKMVNQLQTPIDTQELRTQLRNLQQNTQVLVKDTSTLLIEMMNMPVGPQQNREKQIKSDLSELYLSTLNKFQTIQKTAAQKTKDEVRKNKNQNYNVNDPFGQNRSSRGAGEETFIDVEVNARQQEQMTLQSERELAELEQVERDMQQLESGILAVNDIFKKLAETITEQGAVVDSIEASIERTADNVQEGGVQLRQAAVYQNKARRKKIYMLIGLLIVVTIILIIIFAR